MSLSSRRIVPLYVVAALIGAAGSCATAMAQTVAPPAAAANDAAAAVEAPTATKPSEGVTVASEQVPVPGTELPAPDNRAAPQRPDETPPAAATPPASVQPASAETPPSPPAPAAAEASQAAPEAPSLAVDVASALARLPARQKVEKRDREGLVAAYKAREGRPIWMTAKGATPEAVKLAAEIAEAGDWGLDASAFDLPPLTPARADAPDLAPDVMADAEVRLSLATLSYARHARGGRFEPTDVTKYLDRKAPLYEPESILEQIATAAEPDDYLRKLHPQHRQFELLRQRYLAVRDEPAPKKGPSEAERILANMEQWRWMPTDLGAFHIWVNIPEQMFYVLRDGKVIHSERVIVGKTNTQTPVFSDRMRFLVFHPFWGVPNSIKTNDILPGLQRGRAILERRNLRLQLNGKDVDPARFDWRKTDIRRFHVYQAPSSGNALGVVKFMFPNKHDVYLHDTPSKSLFKQSVRAISAGCVRVQNPLRFAELLLAEDQGLSAESVRALVRKGAPENNQVNLKRPIPVHLAYFTMWAAQDGKIASFRDIYGHEERVRLALAGKMHLITPVPEPEVPTGPVGRLVEVSPAASGASPRGSRRPGSFNGFGGSGYSSAPPAPRPDWGRRMFSGSDIFAGGN